MTKKKDKKNPRLWGKSETKISTVSMEIDTVYVIYYRKWLSINHVVYCILM